MKNKITIYIVIGIMCAILTYGILVQIRTVESFGTVVGSNSKQSELKDEILKLKEKIDNLYKNIEKSEETLEKERNNATNNNSELTALEEQIKETNILLGLTEVTGTGINVALQDSSLSSINYLGNANDLIIHDGDIIHVVNELFNAGAEAISINGQRVVATTAIECDGNVIKINGTKIGNPFEIKAIGYPEQLSGIARTGGYLEKLESRGIVVSLTKEENIKIPKYTGTYKFNYIEEQ